MIIKSELGEMKNTKKLQADPVNVKTATKRRQLGITVISKTMMNLDFWTKSTTMGPRDWCDRLRQAEQKFREAAEKNTRLEEVLREVGPACAYDKLRSRSLF